QRVAIARALVNDPDIVLADEPTGALDSDTSVQIMNLLKEVAKDRLVVMVTHNPELAEQYATRIVNLRDGVIRSDSAPFEIDEASASPAVHKTMGKASMSFATSLALSFNNLKTKKARTLLTSFAGSIGIIGIALILSVSTGVNAYIDNIQRDTMTAYPITIDEQTFDMSSIMGSQMGGDDGYGGKTHKSDGIYPDDRSIKQASSLTSSITENNLTSFKKYLDDQNSEIHQYVGSTGIQYTYDVKFSVFDRDPDGTLVNANGVTIGSDGSASMASQMASTSSTGMSGSSSITSKQMSMLTGKTDENAAPDSFSEIMPGSDDSQLVGKVITDNYRVVDGSWPTSKDEVVLVLDDNNSVPLTTLYELGLLPASDYNEMMSKLNAGDKVSTPQGKIDYAKALDQTLYLIPASDQYVKGDDGHYRFIGDDKDAIEQRLDSATKLKVVGVVKAKKDASATPLAAGVGYTRALTNDLIDRAASSAIVTDQKADPNVNVLNGMTFSPSDDATKAADARTYVASLGVTQKANMAKSMMGAGQQSGASGAAGAAGAAGDQATAMAAMSEQQLADSFDAYIATASDDVLVAIYDQYVSTGTYDDNLAAFGVVSRDAPSSINIYADSFEDKDHIADAITDYNKTVSKKDKITYTDYVGLMMSSVTTIVNVISYVLIAFVSVSLIVSSIMIGIITYISVLERTKEIGILRAMGASKHNVSQVFNAETGIIGLCSGLLGVGLTVLLNFPINAVLHHFIGNADVNAALPVTGGVVLVILSVVLTLIGGLIPSRKAAKQDPATALRTE
ncbi:FtsX-like permease family protein, partial [Bifidobacterium scardovii]